MENSRVVAQFGLSAHSIVPITGGLINQTYLVHTNDERPWILQSVNPIFSPEVHLDIEAVTEHLAAKGFVTPLLRRTGAGKLWHVEDKTVWRMMTYVDGHTIHRAEKNIHAAEAGRMLALFHEAMHDLDYAFQAQRVGVHDTPRHIEVLQSTLTDEAFNNHEHHAAVERCTEGIFDLLAKIPPLPHQTPSIVHGDPKISNILFGHRDDRAICMVDLDTVGKMETLLELGDAFRSWCNPSADGENNPSPEFSLEFFEAAISAYAQAAPNYLSEEEWTAIPDATMLITLELAIRFAADSLRESYFGWDPARFGSRGTHNLTRAQGQLELAQSFFARRDSARRTVTKAFEHAKG